MSDDKLSEEEMREEIKNLISWGHAHDYDDIVKEARADAWDEAANTMRLYVHRNGLTEAYQLDAEDNPYRKQEEA